MGSRLGGGMCVSQLSAFLSLPGLMFSSHPSGLTSFPLG